MASRDLLRSLKIDTSDWNNLVFIGVNDWVEYENGKRTDNVVGANLTVVVPSLMYEKIVVKVEGLSADRLQEQLDNSEGQIFVKFEGLEVGLYQDFTTKQVRLTARAKGII